MPKINRSEACAAAAFRQLARSVAIALAGNSIACGGASSADTSAQSVALRWGGYWSCDMRIDDGGITTSQGFSLHSFASVVMAHDANGQTAPVSELAIYGPDAPIVLYDWLSSCMYYSIVDSSTAIADGLNAASCSITMLGGSVAISADANTLTIHEAGTDATTATAASMDVTCQRTGPADPPSTSGSSSGGSSGAPTPECTNDNECGSCAMCLQGTCNICPIGSLGICTC